MIVKDKPCDVVINGNFQTSGFAIADEAFIFDMVSNGIYTHKARAVLREIGCNAEDSHVLAGQNRKFYVHLPTFSEPYMLMRDYGVGLTEEEVRNIYCTIGFSSKTNSNDFTGCLGIGTLSPYCISDTFHVISYKDGEKSTYVCYKDENRKGSVSLLLREETDEPNGLEVKVNVPTNMNWDFKQEAVRVFKHFKNIPEFNIPSISEDIELKKESMNVVDGLYYLNNSGSRLVAIMGNVEYNIPQNYNKYNLSGGIYFDMGELQFNPGREELSLDAETIKVLKTRIDEVIKRLSDDIIAEIEEEDDLISKIIKFHSYKSNPVWEYIKQSDLSKKYKKPVCKTEFVFYNSRTDWRKTVVESHKTTVLPVKGKVGYFLNKKGYTARIRYNIKEGIYNKIVLLTQEQIDEMKIDKKHIRDLSNLEAPEKINRIGTSSKVFKWNKKTYRGNDAKLNWGECTVPDNEEKVFIEINRYNPVDYYNYYYVQSTLSKLESFASQKPEIYGIKTAFLKTEKFKEQNWISLKDYTKREMAKIASKTMNVLIDGISWSKLEDISLLSNDQDIKYLLENKPDNKTLVEFLSNLGYTIPTDDSLLKRYSIVEDRYPMLFNPDDSVIAQYMKDIYDSTKTS